ncbi:hypothetical protein ACI2OX_18595 [Bacillus sp. N9]
MMQLFRGKDILINQLKKERGEVDEMGVFVITVLIVIVIFLYNGQK